MAGWTPVGSTPEPREIPVRQLILILALCLAGCPGPDAAGGGGRVDDGDRDTGGGGDVNEPDAPDTADVPDTPDAPDTPDPEQACARDGECTEQGELCVVDRDNGAMPTACGEPVGQIVAGAACAEDADCASNLCHDGSCSSACLGDADCPSQFDCRERVLSDVVILKICVEVPCRRSSECEADGQLCVFDRTDGDNPTDCAPPVGDGEPGADCDEDAACQTNLCEDGACAEGCVEDGDCAPGLECVERELAEGLRLDICGVEICASDDDCPDEGEICTFNRDDAPNFVCGDPVGDGEDGAACVDDGDCAGGLCVDGRCADRCTEDADCSPGACQTQTIPAGDGELSLMLCVYPDLCERRGDCDGAVCVFGRGPASVVLYCDDAEGGSPGAACETDGACDAGLCHEGFCSDPCVGGEDCGPGFACQEVEITLEEASATVRACVVLPEGQCRSDDGCDDPDLCVGRRRPDRIDFVCNGINDGGGRTGATCAQDTDCQRNLCLEGTCREACGGDGDCAMGEVCRDAVATVEEGQVTVQVCQDPRPCAAPDECNDGRTCVVRNIGDDDVQTVCLRPNQGGDALGAACAAAADCANNLCLDEWRAQVCSHPCDDDGDCAGDYVCQVRPLRGTPVSERSVCVPPEPDTCVTNADCDRAQRCSVVVNREADALVRICIDPPGAGAPGAECDADTDCETGICLGQTCSALCRDVADCADAQLCDPVDIDIEEIIGRFNLCRTLPDIACQRNADCTDGDRVCGNVRFEDPVQPYCIEPELQGDPNGTPCDGRFSPNEQCHDRICLGGITDECTTTCVDADDCAGIDGTYTCTDFRFSGDTVRMCADDCGNDADCDRDAEHHCGLIRNVTDDRFEFICRRPTGEDGPGADCSEQVNCDHGLCLIRRENNEEVERVCTIPCQTNDDCPEILPNCGEANISRPMSGESQSLRICNRL